MLKLNKVINPKRDGGLGLGDLEKKNWMLLAKWWWVEIRRGGAFWSRIIANTYGEDKWGWLPKPMPSYPLPI